MAVKIRKVKKRTAWKSLALTVAMGLAALGSLVYLGISNWRMYNDWQAVNVEAEKLENQIRILLERQQMLKAGLNAAQGEGFQEEKMREQGYKKPGEEVIAVLQDKPANATKQEGTAAADNFWMALWQKIQGTEE